MARLEELLECQAELGDIARIAEVRSVFLGIVLTLWYLCECQVEFGNIAKICR